MGYCFFLIIYGRIFRLRLWKRQDLLGLAIGIVRPQADRVTHKINLDRNEMDTFVLIFGQRKYVARTVREFTDLVIIEICNNYCVCSKYINVLPYTSLVFGLLYI